MLLTPQALTGRGRRLCTSLEVLDPSAHTAGLNHRHSAARNSALCAMPSCCCLRPPALTVVLKNPKRKSTFSSRARVLEHYTFGYRDDRPTACPETAMCGHTRRAGGRQGAVTWRMEPTPAGLCACAPRGTRGDENARTWCSQGTWAVAQVHIRQGTEPQVCPTAIAAETPRGAREAAEVGLGRRI